MIIRLFSNLLPCLYVGYLLGLKRPKLASQIAKPLINYGVPLSVMGLLLKSGINWQLIEAFAIALLAIGLLVALIQGIPQFNNLMANRTLILGSAFGNSGYFGIPVALALLPSQALQFSIGYDLGATLLIWSIGPIVLAQSSTECTPSSCQANLGNRLIQSPATQGLIGAVLVQCTPWQTSVTTALWIPCKIVIILGLLIVGMRLSWLDPSKNKMLPHVLKVIQPSLLIKHVILPALMLIISISFGLPTLMRNALVLQAATPTAISVLLVAETNHKDQEVAASLVVVSTLLALFTMPIWSIVLL